MNMAGRCDDKRIFMTVEADLPNAPSTPEVRKPKRWARR